MKHILTTFIFISASNIVFSQSKISDPDAYTLAIATNAGISSTNQDTRKESKAGVGSLGVKFEKRFWFGEVDFTTFSRNDSVDTRDSLEIKRFGSNMMLPQNSQGGFNNFFFEIGCRSFVKYDSAVNEPKVFSWQRMGFNAYVRSSSTRWSKDTVSLPIVLGAYGFYLTYSVLNLEMQNQVYDRVRFSIYAGLTGRYLGGDYGLNKNDALRKYFLGTPNRSFNCFEAGARLEIGSLFASGSLTTFPMKDNIEAFSGTQVVMNLGIRASLDIPAKSVKGFNK